MIKQRTPRVFTLADIEALIDRVLIDDLGYAAGERYLYDENHPYRAVAIEALERVRTLARQGQS